MSHWALSNILLKFTICFNWFLLPPKILTETIHSYLPQTHRGKKRLFLISPKKYKSNVHFQPMDLSCEVLKILVLWILDNSPNFKYEKCLIYFRFTSKEHSQGEVMTLENSYMQSSRYHHGKQKLSQLAWDHPCCIPNSFLASRFFLGVL